MESAAENWTKQTIEIILVSITFQEGIYFLNFYYMNEHQSAVLRNPFVLNGNIMIGTEIKINLYSPSEQQLRQEAELILSKYDFLPEAFSTMLEKQPPVLSTFFGLISKPRENSGRYYMLRDHNADGLLLCTGTYFIKNNKGYCRDFDAQWPLRYNIVENFFYGVERQDSEILKWKHPSIRLAKIDDDISIKNLNKRFRNFAAGWHRYNFFSSDDWSLKFYRKQARLGFIAITRSEGGRNRITPQLQREYAVLDWDKLTIDRKTRRIIKSGRLETDSIRLRINPDPAEALEHLAAVWSGTWITKEYSSLIQQLAAECRFKNDRHFRIWGVTLSAGSENKVIAGELGYSIGKTYTSLSGFFHRGKKQFNNFGKLQMVLLADVLKQSGIAFWNLGQPYMEYKLKLGAAVVPRGLFLKRWDKAVKGRISDLSEYSSTIEFGDVSK